MNKNYFFVNNNRRLSGNTAWQVLYISRYIYPLKSYFGILSEWINVMLRNMKVRLLITFCIATLFFSLLFLLNLLPLVWGYSPSVEAINYIDWLIDSIEIRRPVTGIYGLGMPGRDSAWAYAASIAHIMHILTETCAKNSPFALSRGLSLRASHNNLRMLPRTS